MKKKTTLLTAGVTIAIIAAGTYWSLQEGRSLGVEELRADLERITQYELEHGCVEEQRGQPMFCGESKERVDRAYAAYQQTLDTETNVDSPAQEKDIAAIRAFMDDTNLSLTYIRSRSPANFSVGVSAALSDGGDSRTDVPQEWKRPIARPR